MAVNKVEVGGEAVIDLTADTVSENNLLVGATAHNSTGEPIEGAVGAATPDSDGLMSAADKKKLDGIDANANYIVVDSELSETSENPVQNKIITKVLNEMGGGSSGNGFVIGSYSGTDAYADGGGYRSSRQCNYESENSTPYYTKMNITANQSGSHSTIIASATPVSQTIDLGFQPSVIIIDGLLFSRNTYQEYVYTKLIQSVNGGSYNTTYSGSSYTLISFDGNTITVNLRLNSGSTHNFIAFF